MSGSEPSGTATSKAFPCWTPVNSAAEVALPEVAADHRHRSIRSAAPHIVRRAERAPDDGAHTEDVEILTTRHDAVDELGFAAGREVEPRRRVGEGAVEDLPVALADLFPERVGPGWTRSR
jgi:hypothetical protein